MERVKQQICDCWSVEWDVLGAIKCVKQMMVTWTFVGMLQSGITPLCLRHDGALLLSGRTQRASQFLSAGWPQPTLSSTCLPEMHQTKLIRIRGDSVPVSSFSLCPCLMIVSCWWMQLIGVIVFFVACLPLACCALNLICACMFSGLQARQHRGWQRKQDRMRSLSQFMRNW